MAEIGDFDDSPVIPRERIRPPQRMQPCDGQKTPRDRHACRGQPPAEPVEQRFRRYIAGPGFDQPSMQGDEVGSQIWHALEKVACDPALRNAFPPDPGHKGSACSPTGQP
jgi:hypothetical protein